MSNIIGAPNHYRRVELVSVQVADQSEIQAAFEEMTKDGYMPFPHAFGRVESKVSLKPSLYLIGWKIAPMEDPT